MAAEGAGAERGHLHGAHSARPDRATPLRNDHEPSATVPLSSVSFHCLARALRWVTLSRHRHGSRTHSPLRWGARTLNRRQAGGAHGAGMDTLRTDPSRPAWLLEPESRSADCTRRRSRERPGASALCRIAGSAGSQTCRARVGLPKCLHRGLGQAVSGAVADPGYGIPVPCQLIGRAAPSSVCRGPLPSVHR